MGLIQYGIEKAGIPAISITHLAHLTRKVRVSRALQTKFPLGRSFGKAGEVDMQSRVLRDCLHYLKEIKESEMIVKLPYKWEAKMARSNKHILKIGQAKSIQRQKAHTMRKVFWHVRWMVLSLLIICNAIGLMNSLLVPFFSRYEWDRI